MSQISVVLVSISSILSLLMVGFCLKFNAPRSLMSVFIVLFLSNIVFTGIPILDTVRAPLIMTILFIKGPVVWWLVRSHITGDRGFLPWPHIIPIVFALIWRLTASGDIVLIPVVAAPIWGLAYGILAIRDFQANRSLFISGKAHLWFLLILIMAVWVGLWSMFNFLQAYLQYRILPEGVGMLIQAIIYSGVTLTFVWWALVTPDTYLQSTQTEQSTSPKPSEFDQEVFSRLENIFGTEKPYLDATVNLETLAHQIAVTPRELSNAVNRCTNDGFRAFLRKKRVDHAQELLTNKTCQDLSIYDIAIASGFGTKSTFNESFKLHTGMPPSEFRRQFKEAT